MPLDISAIHKQRILLYRGLTRPIEIYDKNIPTVSNKYVVGSKISVTESLSVQLLQRRLALRNSIVFIKCRGIFHILHHYDGIARGHVCFEMYQLGCKSTCGTEAMDINAILQLLVNKLNNGAGE